MGDLLKHRITLVSFHFRSVDFDFNMFFKRKINILTLDFKEMLYLVIQTLLESRED